MLLIALTACGGVSNAGSGPDTDLAATRQALQSTLDDVSLEATVVMATMIATDPQGQIGANQDDTITRRYEANLATLTALQPTLEALETPLEPLIRPPRNPTEAAQMATALAVGAAANNLTPTPWHTPTNEPATTQLESATPQLGDHAMPAGASLPEAALPAALAGIQLPTSREAVETLFAALPAQIGEAERVEFGPVQAHVMNANYGMFQLADGSQAARISLSAMTFRPDEPLPADWDAASYVQQLATSHAGIVATGRDGQLVWLRRELAHGNDPRHIRYDLMLGAVASPWIFSLSALSASELDQLSAVFRAQLP
ncbi:MAG: hypothetical protein AB4911_24140 [Oscillochloridaceae bacterium umkhey_bin13]